MSISLILALMVLAFLALIAVRRVQGGGTSGAAGGVQPIDNSGLSALMAEQKVQLIDVRTPQEFASGSVKGFKNIPLQLLQDRLGQLDPTVPVVVICASGARSTQGAKLLAQAGFSQVYNFKGGMAAYKK